MELADVTDSKSVGLITRAGSTPATGTKKTLSRFWAVFFYVQWGRTKPDDGVNKTIL